MNNAVLVAMQKLDRILDGEDVITLLLINEVDDSRQGGRLPGTRWPGYQNNAVTQADDLFEFGGETDG